MPLPFKAFEILWIADNCGYPTPAIIRVVHIEPGPIPTLIPSTPALAKNFAASPVAILPATTSSEGNFDFNFLIVSKTELVWACAVSITTASNPALYSISVLSIESPPTPTAAATLNLPNSSLFEDGFIVNFWISLKVIKPINL